MMFLLQRRSKRFSAIQIDLGMEIVEGKERFLSLGETSKGRVLLVVTTWREHRIRVVTAFEPVKRLVRFYYREKRR